MVSNKQYTYELLQTKRLNRNVIQPAEKGEMFTKKLSLLLSVIKAVGGIVTLNNLMTNSEVDERNYQTFYY